MTRRIRDQSLRHTLGLVLMAVSMLSCAADAQTVIMRKPLGGATFGSGPGGYVPPETVPSTPAPTPTPATSGNWTVSAPTSVAPACSDAAPAVRDVWCAAPGGERLSDESCAGTRPDRSVTVADHRACAYSWSIGDWSAWSSTCSKEATHTRTVTCTRSDGTAAVSTLCDQSVDHATSETSALETSCSYDAAYGAWTACAGGQRTAAISRCTRSDQTDAELTKCSPQSKSERCYSGTWSTATQYVTTSYSSCSVGKRTITKSAGCVDGGSADVTGYTCDPASQPAPVRTTETCAASCEVFEKTDGQPVKYDDYRSLITMATPQGINADKLEEARLACEKYAPASQYSRLCIISPRIGTTHYNVGMYVGGTGSQYAAPRWTSRCVSAQ